MLSPKEAHEIFYRMHVNTRGRVDSHIAVDMQMEFVVRSIKRHIKHMFSNKTEKNIERKTGTLAAINNVLRQYDATSETVIRSKKHKQMSAPSDELDMAQDLRNVKPFREQRGRQFEHFENINNTLIAQLDFMQFREWMKRRGNTHVQSLGD